MLGFDCGGQQWVLEMAFPTGEAAIWTPRPPCYLVMQPLRPYVDLHGLLPLPVFFYVTQHPAGTLERPTFADLAYMEQLLKQLEVSKIPAPSPIEQRWTSSSSSPMSPAFSKDPKAVYSWVGIIMYLPAGDVQQRELITAR